MARLTRAGRSTLYASCCEQMGIGHRKRRGCRTGIDSEDTLGDPSPLHSIETSFDESSQNGNGKLLGTAIALGGLLLLIGGGFIFKDQIRNFLLHFTGIVDDMGPMGFVLYAMVYAGLEVLAVPAIPLTMASGAIFGIVPGSILVSFAGTLAATTSFLIARYAARDKVR
jgi:hypothetical protein